MTCLKRHRKMLDSVPGGRAREKVQTGGSASKNHAPSCVGYAFGRGQTREDLDYSTGR